MMARASTRLPRSYLFGRGSLVLVTAAAFTLLLSCDDPDQAKTSASRGALEIGFEASSIDNACSTCRALELEDLAGVRRTYSLDLTNVLRIGREDIASIDVMAHDGSGPWKNAWSVVITLTGHGQRRLTEYCENRSGRALLTANSEILIAALDREHVAGRRTIAFVLTSEELLEEFAAQVGPLESAVPSASQIDSGHACEIVARGRSDLLATCLELVDRDWRASRREEALLDHVLDEVSSGRMSEEEAVRLLEEGSP